MADEEKLKRERAGTYRTLDGRFTVEQSTTGWLLLDGEQTNELGLPLARGPYTTLDEARAAIGDARSGPRPISDLGERRRAKAAGTAAPKPEAAGSRQPRPTRQAAKRATGRELVIREMRTADGDTLRELWTSVGFRSVGDDDRSLARLVRRNPGLALVATEGSRIVGSALGAWDGRRGWIYHVATARSHRRRGIASRLVERVEAGLGDLGCPKINVIVRDEADGGAAFWKARGYEVHAAKQYGKELDGGSPARRSGPARHGDVMTRRIVDDETGRRRMRRCDQAGRRRAYGRKWPRRTVWISRNGSSQASSVRPRRDSARNRRGRGADRAGPAPRCSV